MTPDEIQEKLARHAEQLKAYGQRNALPSLPRGSIQRLWQENGPDQPVTPTRVTMFLEDGHVLAHIEPDGRMTLAQNWHEPGQLEKQRLETGPSPETLALFARAAAAIEGRRPHPEITWKVEHGPWVTAEMEGRTILEAGVSRGLGGSLIFLSDGSRPNTFADAEDRLDRSIFPQYTPISLERAKTALQGT